MITRLKLTVEYDDGSERELELDNPEEALEAVRDLEQRIERWEQALMAVEDYLSELRNISMANVDEFDISKVENIVEEIRQ